jgi:alpha-D-ribose 1-methylphosphonate 5-triphosphate synthase subunit PhnL
MLRGLADPVGESPAARRAHGLARTPTAAVVVDLVAEARDRGAAIIGTFHNREVRQALSTRLVMLHGAAA